LKRLLILLVILFVLAGAVSCAATTVPTTAETTSTTTLPTSETTTTLDFSSIAVTANVTNATSSIAAVTGILPWIDGTTGTIAVDDLIRYEPYAGTGAALTYSAAWLIDQSPDRDEIIDYIFGTDGLNVQLIRLAIGTSDFTTSAAGHYTYDDTPGNVADMDLSDFSIEQDRVILDVLKDALDINPDLTFIAAPWSAPAWMKTNKSLYGGSLSSSYYNVYADYLIRFLEAYRDEGIEIAYLSVQNEPYYAPYDYPGMLWTIDATKIFIRDFLGPKKAAAGFSDVKLMIWDHNPVDGGGAISDFPVRVLKSAETAAYVGAVGVHCYSGDDADMYAFLDDLHAQNPEMELFMTECTATTAYTNREQNMEWSVRRMYIEAYNRTARGTTYWNLAMDPAGATHLGGCSTCTGLVTITSTGYRLEADGYVTAHFSKYVRVGAERIETTSSNDNVLVVGYLADDGTITLVVWNDGAARPGAIVWRGKKCVVPLASNSLTTIRWTMPETETP